MHHFRRFGFVSGCLDHDWSGRCGSRIGPFVRSEYYERSGENLLSHCFWF